MLKKMSILFEQRVKFITAGENSSLLKNGLKGLEKESLRVTRSGSVSQNMHPAEWGAALTNPHITTDYSEALPEFITPPFESTNETYEFLTDIHSFAIATLPENEIIWNNSMPCDINDEKEIPIARYGKSNQGRMRHIYRVGLDYRYGRRMQAIAGIHFNYSLPEQFWEHGNEMFMMTSENSTKLKRNPVYLGLARNYLRYGWLVLLLFGCSPACCKSYLPQRNSRFKPLRNSSLVAPYGTSLRMSDVGYKNKNQAHLKIKLNNIEGYIGALNKAMRTPYPEYEAIGIYEESKQIQLSANLLQIENEYYSSIRPKGNALEGQRPSIALRNKGIQYIEMRSLDVNPMNPFGVERDCLLFCEIFLIYCLLEESPLISDSEHEILEYNELSVALRGRQPNLKLITDTEGNKSKIIDWSNMLLVRMLPIAEALDRGYKTTKYSETLKSQLKLLKEPDLLPSAKFHQLLVDSRQEFQNFNLELSIKNTDEIRKKKLTKEQSSYFQSVNHASWEKQKKLEMETINHKLSDYIKNYLSD